MIKIITTISLLFFIACNQPIVKNNADTNTKPTISTDWKTLVDKDYSIQYPESWSLSQEGELGTELVLISAFEDEKDKFRENINLLIQDLNERPMYLDEFTERSLKEIKSSITGAKIIESQRVETENGEYHKAVFISREGSVTLMLEQYYLLKNNKAYVLTFACEKNKLSSFKEVGEKILDSFKLHLADSK